MRRRILSLLLAVAMLLSMVPLSGWTTAATVSAVAADGTVFANYGTPVIDGALDLDSRASNLNSIWPMNAKIGADRFSVMWDHDYLYLAIDTANTDAVTVNGTAVTTVNGAVREAKIALADLGIYISDYNDTAAITVEMGENTFTGTVKFGMDESVFIVPNSPNSSGVTCGAVATATRSADYKTFTFGIKAGEASHTGWVAHTIYSSTAVTRGMPAVDANGVVTSDDTHVVEFDFAPTALPEYASADKGFWYDKWDYRPVNGFNMSVQYDKTAVASTGLTDGGSGHAYAIGITNIDGALTLVVRTAYVSGIGCAKLYPIAAAGEWSVADMYRIRLEYDFSTGLLDAWADGKYLGQADPMAIKVTSGASNTVRMELYSMNKVGTWSGDCADMSFQVANVYAGMKENDSVYAQTNLLDAVDTADILGENTDATAITTNLSLPAYLSHEIFNGIALDWTSSIPAVINDDGVVTQSSREKDVTMTVKLNKAPEQTKTFDVTVAAKEVERDITVFAPFGTPTIDGTLDVDSTFHNLNTIWLMNAKIGDAPFGMMWDHDYLYLAIDTDNTGAVTVNGVEVTTVDNAVREAKIALDTLGIHVADYNDTADLTIVIGEEEFIGAVSFAKDTAMFFDAAAPVITGVTCGATATGTRSSDYSTLTFGLTAGTASHTGWVGHTIYSSKAITRGMPEAGSDDIHVLEFDFTPSNMPALSSTSREGYWYDKYDFNPVNGFNVAVQYDASVTASTGLTDAGTGHSYAAGIVNRGGVLTLVIRTAWATDGCAALFPIAQAGEWNAEDVLRMRFEYDFSTGVLSVWADGNFVGQADPMTIKLGSSANTVRFSLYAMNKVGHWSGDCPTMGFVVANAHSGMKENDSVLTETSLMDGLTADSIVEGGITADDVTLPAYLPHAMFNGIALNWSSSDEEIISNTGKVTQTTDVQNVTMTAQVAFAPERTKDIALSVAALNVANKPHVFAPYRTPVIDGTLDADSTLYNLNTIWLMNAKIGDAPFGMMWDHDYLYLAIDTDNTGAVTVNGVEVTTVNGAVREAKIALDTLGIRVSDYNDVEVLNISIGDASFDGVVVFTKDTAMFFDAAVPVKTVTCDATATGTRSSDYSTLTFGLAAGTASHTGWVGHTIYSSKAITRGMPEAGSDDIHVLEFDFTPSNMPALSSTSREGYWYDKYDFNPVNGFNVAVQYDASVTASTGLTDAGTGHSYAAGIVNRGGVLTLVIRTAWTADGCATLFPIAQAGEWNADDVLRMRFEYDFSTGVLSVWADGNFVGQADPMTIKLGSSANTVRFSLYAMNKVGHWSGDCPTMDFVVANAHSGMKENDSVLAESDLMDALDISDILGENETQNQIDKDLALPAYLPHAMFNGIALDWSSSDESAISNAGVVTAGDEEKSVSMTAAIPGTELSKTLDGLTVPKAVAVNNAAVVAQQVAIGEDLTMNFFVEVDDEYIDETSVEITVDDQPKNYAIQDLTAEADGTYKIAVSLAAAQMADDIAVKILDTTGTVYEGTYSVMAYAAELLKGDFDETKQLVKEMLNYGAKAQLYFGYNTSDLANDGNEIEVTEVPGTAADVEITGGVTGVRFYGASLLFQNKIAVRYYFAVDGDVNNYSFALDGEDCDVQEKDGKYYVESDRINLKNLGTALTVCVSANDETLNVAYSPVDYISRMYYKSGASVELKNLLQALYSYHRAASAYVGEDNTTVAVNPTAVIPENSASDILLNKITTEDWNI